MDFNYYTDVYGQTCLDLASQCKTSLGFGSVLVKDGIIIGKGRNKLSTKSDRCTLSHVDYSTHAEQAAIIDAIENNYNVLNSVVYVLGVVLKGHNKGKLTIKEKPVFICSHCIHSLVRFSISVAIPLNNGWYVMSPQEAFISGKEMSGKGYWNNFVYGQ